MSIIRSKSDHLYGNQSYFVIFPDVLDGSFDGGVEGSLVGESADAVPKREKRVKSYWLEVIGEEGEGRRSEGRKSKVEDEDADPSAIDDLQSHLLRVPLRPLRLGGKSF